MFGIPTIKREKTSYLLNTLASLLDGMTQEDKDDSVIVIFVGEVNTFILLLSQPLTDKSMMCSQLHQISPWIPKGDYRGYLCCVNEFSRNWLCYNTDKGKRGLTSIAKNHEVAYFGVSQYQYTHLDKPKHKSHHRH